MVRGCFHASDLVFLWLCLQLLGLVQRTWVTKAPSLMFDPWPHSSFNCWPCLCLWIFHIVHSCFRYLRQTPIKCHVMAGITFENDEDSVFRCHCTTFPNTCHSALMLWQCCLELSCENHQSAQTWWCHCGGICWTLWYMHCCAFSVASYRTSTTTTDDCQVFSEHIGLVCFALTACYCHHLMLVDIAIHPLCCPESQFCLSSFQNRPSKTKFVWNRPLGPEGGHMWPLKSPL